jgi:hypothetical protein
MQNHQCDFHRIVGFRGQGGAPNRSKAVAEDINSIIPAIMSQIGTAKDYAIANFRGNLIIELSTLTLLIDAKITTHEAAIQRMKEIREWLSDVFPDDELDRRLDRAIDLLREHAKGTKPEFHL